MGLNRFGHVQILMVAFIAKLRRIYDMTIEYVAEHKDAPIRG